MNAFKTTRKTVVAPALCDNHFGLALEMCKRLECRLMQQSGANLHDYRRGLTQLLFAFNHRAFRLSAEQSRQSNRIYAAAMEFSHEEKVQDKAAELLLLGTDEDVGDGFMTCRCGSRRIDWENKHTRSADEGATLFCSCCDCGAKWRISA
jgi:DNA-directed RNA polymerase subunit M/transcription elongation factor TFIIS